MFTIPWQPEKDNPATIVFVDWFGYGKRPQTPPLSANLRIIQ
jgi:hypothetical protein